MRDSGNENMITNIAVSNVGDQDSSLELSDDVTQFLRLNLKFGHKCRRTFFNNSGFIVGSKDYKNCVLSKGIKNNG